MIVYYVTFVLIKYMYYVAVNCTVYFDLGSMKTFQLKTVVLVVKYFALYLVLIYGMLLLLLVCLSRLAR